MYFLFLMVFSLIVVQAQEEKTFLTELSMYDKILSMLGMLNTRAQDECDLGKKFYEEESYRTAYNHFLKAAEQGNTEARFHLGEIYYHGHGVAKDYGQAFELFRLAAEQGHPDAQYYVGRMYEKGEGEVERNRQEAFKWYTKAARQGHPDAQYSLSRMWATYKYDGKPVTEAEGFNMKVAGKWLERAAEQGHREAQFYLGLWYLLGSTGVEKRGARKALEWFERAAEQGLQEAQYALGGIYDDGVEGVEPSPQLSFKWYRRAAKQGYGKAMIAVSESYSEGKGVSPNAILAYAWALRAEGSDLTDGFFVNRNRKNLKSLEARLTPQEIASIKKGVAEAVE